MPECKMGAEHMVLAPSPSVMLTEELRPTLHVWQMARRLSECRVCIWYLHNTNTP